MTGPIRRRNRLLAWLPLTPGGLFLLALFVVPLAGLLVLSLRPTDAYFEPQQGVTAAHYAEVLSERYYRDALAYTVRMALIVTVLCAVVGYPVAWLLVHARSAVLRLVIVLVVVSPLLTSVVVRSFGWRALLAADGPVNRLLVATRVVGGPTNLLTGPVTVIVVVTHVLLPFAIVTLSTALSRIDDAYLRASSSLGARPMSTFVNVVLPLSVPGLVSGAVIVFSLAMGIYVTPLLVGGANQPLAGLRVFDQALHVFNEPSAAAMSFTLFAVSLLAIAVLNGFGHRWERRIHG